MSTSKLAQRLTFESFPDTSLTLLFFDDVTNGSEIKESIVAKDASADAAFIDADMTPGPFLVHLAAYKALAAQKADAQLTHSLHADIVVNMSGAKHIAAALNTFGVSAGTTRLLVAKLDASDQDLEQLAALVKGTQKEVPQQMAAEDSKKLRKAFKVAAPELQVGTVLDAAVCKSALQES